jgi:hypothetical protein
VAFCRNDVVGLAPRTKSFGAHDKHRRLRIHVVGGRAAEARDEGAGIPSAERAEFSGKDNELAGERPMTRQFRRV